MASSTFWTYLKFKIGKLLKKDLVSREELLDAMQIERKRFIEGAPKDAQDELRGVLSKFDHLSNVGNPATFIELNRELRDTAASIVERYEKSHFKSDDTWEKLMSIADGEGVGRSTSARIWKLFLSPFGVHTFFFENHWAAAAVLRVMTTEVINDGYSLDHHPDMRPARVAQREKQMKDIGIDDLRIRMFKGKLVHQNVLILPHKSVFPGNVIKLEILNMDRCLPVHDKTYEHIIGWDVWNGYTTQFYPKERLLHLYEPSMKCAEMGTPTLQPVITDMDSDIGASHLNNYSVQRAGMIGVLISVGDDSRGGVPDGFDSSKFAKRLQKEIQLQMTGFRNANSILVSNYIKGVHKLSEIGDFEASFLKFRVEVAKAICTLLQCPPEKLSISRSQGLQYQAALVEDQINKSFDAAIAAHMGQIDEFINEKILKGLYGITDVRIVANGRFGGLTLNGARASLIASQTGGIFTKNEHRVYFYGVAPLPAWNKEGQEVVDNSKNREADSKRRRYRAQTPQEAAPLNTLIDQEIKNPPEEKDPPDDPPAGALVPAGKPKKPD